MRIVIPLPPITKKNSSRIVKNRRTGRTMVIPSKRYVDYEKSCENLNLSLTEPIDYPCNVQMEYYMPTRRKVDLVNLQEATLDILVRFGVLADDNRNIVYTMDGSKVHYDKANPRTEITITKSEDFEEW
ncbi:MAG: RusA family crossover junction endodeoxyribonuclease [Bacteroidota bacterium]|nr:RusA family crossover junction endodeoxyribonuclease [Bacteroidota bacterium]